MPKWLENGSLDLHQEFIVDYDLVVHLLTLLSYRDQANGVRFKHVKAHSEEPGNEWADVSAFWKNTVGGRLTRTYLNDTVSCGGGHKDDAKIGPQMADYG